VKAVVGGHIQEYKKKWQVKKNKQIQCVARNTINKVKNTVKIL